MGGVETVAAAVRADLAARLPSQSKKQREMLALRGQRRCTFAASTSWSTSGSWPPPCRARPSGWTGAIRTGVDQWISRLLGNAHIDVEAVMAPYARSSGACLRRLSRPRGDHRPEQGQRCPSQGDGVAARGLSRPASGVAREEDARRHRLSRAARCLGDRRRPAARGGRPR